MSQHSPPQNNTTPTNKTFKQPYKKRVIDASPTANTFTKQDFEEMVQNAIKTAMISFKLEVEKLFDEKIKQYETENFIMEQTVDQLEEKLKKVEESIEVLKEKNTTLEKELRENKNDVNDLEQYGRRWNLRIFGIEEKGNEENCKQHIVDLCKTKLNITISENDIDAAHRVGARHDNRPRGIIVRFYRRTIRNTIIRARSALKGSRITVREDLTRLNAALLNRASNHPRVDRTWTWNGKVNALGKNGHRVVLTPSCDIDSVLDITTLGH